MRPVRPIVRDHPLTSAWVALMVLVLIAMLFMHVPWSY